MKVLRCCLVNENGTVAYLGCRIVESVSTNPKGIPITHIVVEIEPGGPLDGYDEDKLIVWPADRIYHFNTEE